MVNFLSSFLPNLRRLLIPIYDLQKKAKKFKWTEEAERAFNDIKKLLISPPVLKAPTPDGLFRLESYTSREGMGGTLLQKQGDESVVIGYHSKRLPKSAKNFGVTELELTGLLVNIHGFMQLLCNRYFKVLVDHKALVPIDTPLSIIQKHIPRQSDIDKIVRNIETHVIHSLELLIQAQDLVKAYQHSTHFRDIYQYITDGKLPSGTKVQNCIRAEALNYVVINHFLFRIDTQKDKDVDKGNLFLLVIPEK